MHRRFLVVPAWEELLQERKDGGGKEGVQGRMRQLWRASFLGALRALSGLVLDLGLLEFLIGRTFLDRGRWDLVPAEVFSGGTRRQIDGRQALVCITFAARKGAPKIE